jgi:hypothetical protein
LARSPDIVGVSTDQIRAEIYGDEGIQGDWRQIWGQVQNRWRAALADIQTGHCGGVLYDATNVRRRSRRQLLHQARTLGFTRCIGLWFDTPLDLCLQRNQARWSRQGTIAPRAPRCDLSHGPSVGGGTAPLSRRLCRLDAVDVSWAIGSHGGAYGF